MCDGQLALSSSPIIMNLAFTLSESRSHLKDLIWSNIIWHILNGCHCLEMTKGGNSRNRETAKDGWESKRLVLECGSPVVMVEMEQLGSASVKKVKCQEWVRDCMQVLRERGVKNSSYLSWRMKDETTNRWGG